MVSFSHSFLPLFLFGFLSYSLDGCNSRASSGPPIWTTQTYSTWNCSLPNITVFDPTFCSGVDLAADNVTEWSTVLMNMNRLNQEIRLTADVQNIWYDGISTDLWWHIRIMGRNDEDDVSSWTLITEQYRPRALTCDKNRLWCDSFYLIQIPFVKYNHYDFKVFLLFVPLFFPRPVFSNKQRKDRRDQPASARMDA